IEGGSEIIMGLQEIVFDADSLPVFCDGFLHQALLPEGVAEVVVRLGEMVVDADRLAVFLDGLIDQAVFHENIAHLVVGGGIIRCVLCRFHGSSIPEWCSRSSIPKVNRAVSAS